MAIYKNTIEVAKNSFHDDGEGVVSFPNGLTISDANVQRNGTRYDINSLDISKYAGQLTADHEDKLQNIIGRVEGVRKNGDKITVDRIVYAVKENPLARLAHDLLIGGFSKAFSTETMGIADSVDGVLANHELVGLSQVVVPNNYSACLNSLKRSLNQAKADGLDTRELEKIILPGDLGMTEKKNEAESLAVEEVVNKANPKDEKDKKLAEEEVEESQEAEEVAEELDVKDEEATAKVEETEEVEKTEEVAETEEEEEKEKKEKESNSAKTAEAELVENEISDEQVQELFDKLDELTELVKGNVETDAEGVVEISDIVDETLDNAYDNKTVKENDSMTKDDFQNAFEEALRNYFPKADAPEFKKSENSVEYSNMDWRDRYSKQVNAAYDAFRLGNIEARKTLNDINKANLAALKEAKIAKNSMTIESMGNFVIPPEMYREIIGKRTDYSALIEATEWRETDSLEFAWLKRNGDISMQNVALCDDGENGNLKPISEYSAEPQTGKLEEMAAVTVVCNAATRFFAVDLLADVAAGYRNDYDRKRAQLVIAKLEQAVVETGNEVSYEPTSDTGAMIAWLEAMAKISDTTTEGILVFNNKTFAKLKAHALQAGVEGPLSSIFIDGEIPRIFGMRFLVVPNDLMPTIESDDSISHQVEGEAVAITHAVFYGDLGEFVGYTSGGLQYDISADASYEVNGTVKSAYQRNELVLRGSFFRGGAIKDTSRISGISQSA